MWALSWTQSTLECFRVPLLSLRQNECCWWANRIFPSEKIRSNLEKFLLFLPNNMTIGSGPSASYSYYCSLMCQWPRPTWTTNLLNVVATLQLAVVTLCISVWTKHICLVESSIQSVTEAKGEGLGAGQWGVPTILNCRSMTAKRFFQLEILFSPANSVLLQV